MKLLQQLGDWLYLLDHQRTVLHRLVTPGPLKDFLSEPFPKPSSLLKDVPILALDFETTGLNPRKDKILSVGYVSMEGNKIKVGHSAHHLVHCDLELQADNVVIHQITDDSRQKGQSLEEVLPLLLQAMRGKVVLAHFARIEKQFLKQACLQVYGYPIVFPVIDTLLIEKRMRERQHRAFDPSELRLSSLRDYYELPGHYAHNALNDALATAELLLAQTSGEQEADKRHLDYWLA